MTLSKFVRNGAGLAAVAAALVVLVSCSSAGDGAGDGAGVAAGAPSPAVAAEAGEAPLALRQGDPPTPLEVVIPNYVPVPAVIVAEAKENAVNGRIETVQATPDRTAIQDDPDRLIGLEQSRVSELFGQPTFVRQDAPAALWRYRSGSCIVDLYLYPTFNEQVQAVGAMRVRHVEVRAATGGKTDVPACLGSLTAQQPGDGRG